MLESIVGALIGGIIGVLISYAALAGRIGAIENKRGEEIVEKILKDQENLRGILGETQIEIGEIDTHEEYRKQQLGHYVVTENGKPHKQHVKFKKEFSEAPDVIVAFSLIDSEINIEHQESPKSIRVKLKAQDITKEGFNLRFSSWDTSRSFQAKAVYIALGKVKQ